MWTPSESVEAVSVATPVPSAVPVATTALPLLASRSSTVWLGSAPVTSKVGVLSLVLLSVDEAPLSLPACRSGAFGVAGGVVSMVTARVVESAELPARS
ncbi:MAG: hypothetical protein U0744_06055 [Gemmataceae bacterium]